MNFKLKNKKFYIDDIIIFSYTNIEFHDDEENYGDVEEPEFWFWGVNFTDIKLQKYNNTDDDEALIYSINNCQLRSYSKGNNNYRIILINSMKENKDNELVIKQSKAVKNILICPNCNSSNIKRNGKGNGKQRYKCKECGHYFRQ